MQESTTQIPIEKELAGIAIDEGPYFVLLLLVGYLFYKFLERTYQDHKEQMKSLQETFKESLNIVTTTFGGRLDKIEETLEKFKR